MGLPASSSGAAHTKPTEVLEAAFVDFFVVLRADVELVRVEDAEVRQAFFVEQHVFGLQRWSSSPTQEDFSAGVQGIERICDCSEHFLAGAFGEGFVLAHVVEQVAVSGSEEETGRTPS